MVSFSSNFVINKPPFFHYPSYYTKPMLKHTINSPEKRVNVFIYFFLKNETFCFVFRITSDHDKGEEVPSHIWPLQY
ncbi:hypothetical protein CMR26_03075 [Bacillus velezensis]|nr:hypothetical protein CMR26_03075 [Bacillus velezensis]RKW74349.1 hypothetical protein D5S11_06555 [Bacillus sp. L75]